MDAPNSPHAHAWFITHGLPAFAHHRPSVRELVARVAPIATLGVIAQVAALVTSSLVAFVLRSPIFDAVGVSPEAVDSDDFFANLVAVGTLAVPAAGAVVCVVLAWVVARLSAVWRARIGVIAMALFIAAPLLARLVLDFTGLFSSSPLRILTWLALRILVVAAVLVAVRAGVGSVASFAWTQARTQAGVMGPLAAKALPLTILTFIFAFFAGETWQVAAALSPTRLAGVIAIVILLAFALITMATSERVDDLVADGVARDRVRGFAREAGLDAPADVPATVHVDLVRAERANLLVLQGTAQLWQTLVFSALVFAFLLGFAFVAVPAATEAAWSGAAPVYLTLSDVELPITLTSVKVGALLAAVSGLSFAGAAATDEFFARSLREKLNDDIERALAVKWCARLRIG